MTEEELENLLNKARKEGGALALSRAAEYVVKNGMTGKEDLKTRFSMGIWLRQRAIDEGGYIRSDEQ